MMRDESTEGAALTEGEGSAVPRLLVLGGITEALALARQLPARHIYSLAGIGRVPTDLTCQVRTGGFGGAEGLATYLRDEAIDLLVDATHPYAAHISQNAATAAALTGVPCWALRRPGWQAQTNDDWREFTDWADLTHQLSEFRRPLFTLGREPLEHLDEIPEQQFWTLRTLDPYPGNARAEVIAARGPFHLEDERELLRSRAIDVLVSKNSGSSATEPKLQVARELGLPVLILARPVLAPVQRQFTALPALIESLREHGFLPDSQVQ